MSTPVTRTSGTVAYWSVLALALVIASTVQPVAHVGDRAAAFSRLAQQAQAQGAVPVIVRLAVPGIDDLTAASVAVPLHDVGVAQAAHRVAADAALRQAIDEVTARLAAAIPPSSYTVNRRYASLPFLALRASPEALAALQASPLVAGIEADELLTLEPPTPVSPTVEAADVPTLNGTVDLVGAATAWSWGYTGAGWYVAVLDTGIRRTHQFFSGKTIVEACFARGADGAAGAGDCPNGQSTQTGAGSAVHYASSFDGYDHGTHVAGIAAGNAGSLAGVAKDANIVAVQVFSKFAASDCDDDSPCVRTWTSDQLAGLDWVYSNRGAYRIASVNMSLGGGKYSSACDSDSRKAAVDNLRAAGIATVIASGNDGYCGYVGAPACISSAITVGATTDSDAETDFNNWHATLQRVFAPGSQIYSATGGSDTSYSSWNGTSMATPHVAGAWALLKQVVSNGSVTDFDRALRDNGIPVTSVCDSRHTTIPRIRVDRAISSLVRYRLTLQSTAFGTTDPAPGTHYYAPGSTITITPQPQTYAAFVNWSGDASGTTYPLQLLMDRDKSVTANFRYISRPNASVEQVLNRSVSQVEYINVLRWGSNPANQGINITRFRIYRVIGNDRESTPLFEAPFDQSEYLHRNQVLGQGRYEIVAVTYDNRESEPARVSVQ